MMRLKVLLPFGVFKDESKVERLTVETAQGSFGLLPKRLDCVVAIVPSILIYQRHLEKAHATAGNTEEDVYVAIDEGVMVKTGLDVVISVRHAVAGTDLKQLNNTVVQEFVQQSRQEKQVHSVFKKMESNFMRRFTAFYHDK